MNTAFGWMGSKRKLAKILLTKVPEHTCYVEPFFGSGALFLQKERVTSEVINDRNDELINFYRVLQLHHQALIQYLTELPTSRALFSRFKTAEPNTMTDIQRAARFYYLIKLAFGSKVFKPSFGTATTASPRHNLATLDERLGKISQRFQNVFIENLDWLDVVKRYDRPHTFTYLDPPYHDVTGYGIDFDQYEAIADFMRTGQGNVMLSINDSPRMLATFSEFHSDAIHYTYGFRSHKKKPVVEMIYTNYQPPG